MKFWIYAIDWRSMAIEILGERTSSALASQLAGGYVASLPVAERDDFVAFKTIGVTPVTPEWVRDLRDQCEAAGVAFFVKQLSIDGKVTDDVNQFPEDLRIQEFPNQ